MEDWARLWRTFRRVGSAFTPQSFAVSAASRRAWSKPLEKFRLQLTGTKVTASNRPESVSSAARAT